MSETVTFNRRHTTITSTAVDLPYFFTTHNGQNACAVYSKTSMVVAQTFDGMEQIECRRNVSIPSDAETCTEEAFIQAYSKAQLAIEEAFYSACKSVKPAAPFLTEKAL